MNKWVPYAAGLVLAVLVGRNVFPKERVVTEYVAGPQVTDTVYVPELQVDTLVRWRERVLSDTVRVPYEVIISDPVLIPCPDLPPQRGITRAEFGDTSRIAIVDIWGDGQDVRVQKQVQSLWTPGRITYLEASDPIRVDFDMPKPHNECGFLCKLQWGIGGFAAGIVVWEVAR